jgi:hypothetical protein
VEETGDGGRIRHVGLRGREKQRKESNKAKIGPGIANCEAAFEFGAWRLDERVAASDALGEEPDGQLERPPATRN